MLSNPPPLQSGLVRLAITVPSLSSHAWCCRIHPRFNQVLCIWPLQCLLCPVKSLLMPSNPPPLQSGLVRLAITVPSLSSHYWCCPIHPTSIRSCASGHYSAFFVKSCLMMSKPPPLQSGLMHLAITVPSLSSHAWCCPIHPHFNPVLCVWPLQCLLCQVMLDAVESTPASIRSCASGHYSAFSVLSSHYWCRPIHPHFNQVLCVWPLQCLLCQVIIDAVQSTPLQSGLVRLAITAPSLSSHAWWCQSHPRFNQVLCIWPLQCLLCQVMLDAVQSTPTSIRSCASGHYSAFSVKSCLMMSNPPPLQSGLVRLAIRVPSLSSHAWCCRIHPLQSGLVHLAIIVPSLSCQVIIDAVQSTPTSIRSCASGHYSAFSVKSLLMLSNPPPLQSGLVRLAITAPSLSSHAWWCQIHPRFNQPGLVHLAITVPSLSSHAWCCPIHPTSIRYCASGHYSAFSVKSCLMMSNPPPLQSGLVRLAITVPSLSSHAWCCPIHPRFNQVLCIWPL